MKASFVIPFYGEQIGGGAETQCRRLAENLSARGVDVEVLTTTLRSLASDWSHNYWDAGTYEINGVPVRRFEVRPVDGWTFARVNRKLVAGEPLTLEEEVDYMNNAVNSDALYRFIGDNQRGRFYFFIPYLFGTSLNGSAVSPAKSFLIPCLHDEGYAYMSVTRRMFDRVSGALFNSRAELRLAQRLYEGLKNTEPILMGEGVDFISGADPERFRKNHGLGDGRFMLYVGRRDEGKNVPLLIDYFRRYKELKPESDMKLVLIGSGAVDIPAEIADDTIDLGFVSRRDKEDAYAAAEFLCQPSVMESFSLVIMESWLCGRPVLVHSGCGPTAEHVNESGGGLAFESFPEFFEAVETLAGEKELACSMGERGRKYVEANYSWNTICARFKRLFAALEELRF